MIKSFKSNKGFTLVELIIVIAILAIIMLIAIPNFSGIQQRMQVRADKATAAQIGKAVRVWFTDYTTDGGLRADADNGDYLPIAADDATAGTKALPVATTSGAKPISYEKLAGIEEYIAIGQEPSSLKDATTKGTVEGQAYGIALTSAASSSSVKVVVTIGKATDGVLDAPTTGNWGAATYDSSVVDYDGSKPAVAYVEP